jgi:hypothetical protein
MERVNQFTNMSILTKNRILQRGDQFYDGANWKDVPAKDHGIQILFTKYDKVRRPSEADPTPQTNGKTLAVSRDLTPDYEAVGKTISPDSGNRAGSRSVVTPAKAESDSDPALSRSGAGERPLLERLAAKAKPEPEPEPKMRKVAEVHDAEQPERPLLPPSVNLSGDLIFAKGHKPCQWLGRNGQFDCVGLNMFKGNTGTIWITPFGKRGLGRCMIEFPESEVPRIIEWLQKATKP